MKPTIAQFLKVRDFPFHIKDKNDKVIYYEDSQGFWLKRECNAQGKESYTINSEEVWNRPEVVEMTLQQIADKLGVDVSRIRIKD